MFQIKLSIASLLKTYKFSVNDKTADPIRMRTDTVVVVPKDKILLDVQKLYNK